MKQICKSLNLRIDHIQIVELEFLLRPNPKMQRNYRKHINRVKRTKWANEYFLTGEQPNGRPPTQPAFNDFNRMGFELQDVHCPAVVYMWAICAAAVLELAAQ